jgi:thiol:disulfide interchange protein
MRRLPLYFGLLSAFLLPAFHPVSAQLVKEYAPFYAVSEYDEARDPAADLAATVARAQEEGKRILLKVGGEWCGWCKLLDAYIHEHPAVYEKMEAGFLIIKVNWSRGNQNEAFLNDYPEIRGYPHLFVLEKDGTLLHSQNTGDLEEGRSYDEDVVLAFLDEWMPSGD